MLTKTLIRKIVRFHEGLPKDLSASIEIHPKSLKEFEEVKNLMDELSMSLREDDPVRVKTSYNGYFSVTFFKP